MTIPAAYRKPVYIIGGIVGLASIVAVAAIYTGVLDPERLNDSIAATFGIITGVISGIVSLFALLHFTPDSPSGE